MTSSNHLGPARLSNTQRTRLVAILGMLVSSHSGERAAAGQKAEDLLRRLGMRWEDVIIAATAGAMEPEPEPRRAADPPPRRSSPPPDDKWRETLAWCMRPENLSRCSMADAFFLNALRIAAALRQAEGASA